MNRRQLLAILGTIPIGAVSLQWLWANVYRNDTQVVLEDFDESPVLRPKTVAQPTAANPRRSTSQASSQRAPVSFASVDNAKTQAEETESTVAAAEVDEQELQRRRYLEKMKQFNTHHPDDVFLSEAEVPLLLASFDRLNKLQQLVGHGNFSVLSFDEAMTYARNYSKVGRFSADELNFLEKIFSDDAARYGFLGEKVQPQLTTVVAEKDRIKVPYSGHFLYRGESLKVYETIQRDIGDTLILSSGIRSIIKQMHLFLAKTIEADGNLSLASRSLAPPGHSFHGIGDFDVGKVGFGKLNFTQTFSTTEEFRKLVDLGYVEMRYPEDNGFGVRFEPWHIKVV